MGDKQKEVFQQLQGGRQVSGQKQEQNSRPGTATDVVTATPPAWQGPWHALLTLF